MCFALTRGVHVVVAGETRKYTWSLAWLRRGEGAVGRGWASFGSGSGFAERAWESWSRWCREVFFPGKGGVRFQGVDGTRFSPPVALSWCGEWRSGRGGVGRCEHAVVVGMFPLMREMTYVRSTWEATTSLN